MRKVIAIIVMVCMVLSVTAFANESAELEKIILRAKSILGIPEEMTEFDYNLRSKDGKNTWFMRWNNETGEKSLSATLSGDGDLLSYSNYSYDEEKGSLISVDKAIEIAGGFAAKVMGGDFDSMRLSDKESIPLYSYSDSFIIRYERFENDIPVYGQYCEVQVDKFTGKVEYYHASEFDRKSVFESPDKLIGRDAAIAAFVEEGGFKLEYHTYTDWMDKDKEVKVFPAYYLDGKYVIDAQTGEAFEPGSEEAEKFENALYETAAADSAQGLSPQELKAVEELENLIGEEKAREIIETMVPEFGNEPLSGSKLYASFGDEYIIVLEYGESGDWFGNATLNAVTGEIRSFYFSAYDLEAKMIPSEKEITEFVRSLAGEKAENTVMEVDENYYSFNRTENGVLVSGDGISVSYDKEKGYINSYDVAWTKIDSFPDISSVESPEKILGIIARNEETDLYYLDGNLVYGFYTRGIYNPYTGAKLSYDGEEEKERKVPSYNDIEGHWCENTVKALVENGMTLEGEKFMPDSAVNQRDFVKIVNYHNYFDDDEAIEKYIENHKYFEKVDLDAPVTRNDAAKVFAIMLGYKTVAEKEEIFKMPFADCSENGYAGYIAICKAFGIVSGDENGNFRGESMVTRAEAAKLIYQYICR